MRLSCLVFGLPAAFILAAFAPSAFAQNGRFSQETCAEHCSNFCQTAQDRNFCLGYCPTQCEKQRAEAGSPSDVTGSINANKKPTTTGAKSRP
jgi:hypothetical protein